MTNENDIKEIEINIETAQAVIERMEVFHRLVKNPDFQAVIEKGYFEDEAVRLVGAISAPVMANEFDQDQLQKDMIGVGRLRQYFYAIVQQGRTAEKAIADYHQELDLMREDEANGSVE